MTGSILMPRLYWKELRQLAPLAAILLVLAVLQHLWAALFIDSPAVAAGGTIVYAAGSPAAQFAAKLALYGAPSIFAIGIGAILVSAERDSRTIDWLRSMPIQASTLIRTKIVSALCALAALWLVNAALYWCFEPAGTLLREATYPSFSESMLASILLRSFYLLLISIATAWLVRTPLLALLLILPLSMLPDAILFAIDAFAYRLGQRDSFADEWEWSNIVAHLLSIALAAVAAYGMGLRVLRPRRIAVRSGGASATRDPVWTARRVMPPRVALIWQLVRQDRVLYLLGHGMVLLLSVVLIYRTLETQNRLNELTGTSLRGFYAFETSALLGPWAVLIGVWGIQSDRVRGRVRFLADRGVSAGRYWATRYVGAAISLIILGCGIFAIQRLLNLVYQPHSVLPYDQVSAGIFIGTSVAGGLFAVANWLALWFASPTIAVIAVPAMLGLALNYLFVVDRFFSFPGWLWAALAASASFTSFVSTREWLDSRRGLRFWLRQGVVAAVLLMVPFVPYQVFLVRLPAMPDELRREILATPELHQRVQWGRDYGDYFAEKEWRERLLQAFIDKDADELIDQLDVDGKFSAIVPNSQTLEVLQYVAWTFKPIIDRDQWAGDQRKEIARSLLRRSLSAIRYMREDADLDLLEVLDYFEPHVFQLISRDDATELFGPELYREGVAVLGDAASRTGRRRVALASAYRNELRDYASETYDGRSIGPSVEWSSRNEPDYRAGPRHHSLIDQYASELWRMTKGGNERAMAAARTRALSIAFELHRDARGHTQFRLLPSPTVKGVYAREDDRELPRVYVGMPGLLWYMPWEREAAELKRSLDEEPSDVRTVPKR